MPQFLLNSDNPLKQPNNIIGIQYVENLENLICQRMRSSNESFLLCMIHEMINVI